MNKPTVFISYSHADSKFVNDLAKKLKASGVNVWVDTWKIKVGDSITGKVNEGIGSSDFLIVVLSRTSVASKWVQEEINTALIRNIEQEKHAFILPVLIEDCEIPPILAHRRYANFKDDSEQGFQDLLAVISPDDDIEPEMVHIPAGSSKVRLDIDNLRLAKGMFQEGTWQESQEHSLTLINETGHDLKQCYVMLDELSWKNFEGEWQIVVGDVFSEPFKWNRTYILDGKIDIDDGDRASFAVISHHEYSLYNSSTQQSEIMTDFHFVFHGENFAEIGYGSDIRLRISIKGKEEGGNGFTPVTYLLYVHLLQHHGIPKVDIVSIERI